MIGKTFWAVASLGNN